MARIRLLKPGFFTNDRLAELDPLARLLFAGLWCVADKAGRLEDRPRKIRAEVLPYDDCDVGALLQELARAGFIQRYVVAGEGYVQIVNFLKHQQPHHKEKESEIPPPPGQPPDGGETYINEASAKLAPSMNQACVKDEACLPPDPDPVLDPDPVPITVAVSAGAPASPAEQELMQTMHALRGWEIDVSFELTKLRAWPKVYPDIDLRELCSQMDTWQHSPGRGARAGASVRRLETWAAKAQEKVRNGENARGRSGADHSATRSQIRPEDVLESWCRALPSLSAQLRDVPG